MILKSRDLKKETLFTNKKTDTAQNRLVGSRIRSPQSRFVDVAAERNAVVQYSNRQSMPRSSISGQAA
jgi:hypothetical protein